MLRDFALVFLQKLRDFADSCLLTGTDALCTGVSDLPACMCTPSLSACQGQAAAEDQPEVKVSPSGPVPQGGAAASSSGVGTPGSRFSENTPESSLTLYTRHAAAILLLMEAAAG